MKSDGIIFDMDGTLWDAVDSYATIWNRAIADMRLDVPPVRRPALEKMMGLPLDRIYDGLIGLPEVSGPFMALLERLESEMMPRLGGRLYPGVRETLEALRAGGARLFMVSNCGPDGLPNFLEYTGLGELMTDCLSLGENGLERRRTFWNSSDVIISAHPSTSATLPATWHTPTPRAYPSCGPPTVSDMT